MGTEYEDLVDLRVEIEEAEARIAELEAALTNALYAWGLVSNVLRPYHFPLSDAQKAEVHEAEERIQRARLALPKAQETNNGSLL